MTVLEGDTPHLTTLVRPTANRPVNWLIAEHLSFAERPVAHTGPVFGDLLIGREDVYMGLCNARLIRDVRAAPPTDIFCPALQIMVIDLPWLLADAATRATVEHLVNVGDDRGIRLYSLTDHGTHFTAARVTAV